MPVELKMPALSPTMEEGTLAKWLVAEGDSVAAGDLLAEIETDKATMEFEAVDEGIVTKLVVPAGTEGVKVGAVIALIGAEGEAASPSAAAPAPSEQGGGEAASAPVTAPAEQSTAAVPASSVVPGPEEKGYGANPAEDATIATAQDGPSPASVAATLPKSGERIKASPLARRLAAMKGIDLATLTGTGPDGRIVKADVDGAGAAKQTSPLPLAALQLPPSPSRGEGIAPSSSPSPLEGEGGARGEAVGGRGPVQPAPAAGDIPGTTAKLSSMRKTIARRLAESKQTIPHFYLTVDCNLDALMKLRGDLNKGLEPRGIKLSVNDLLIKALAAALVEVPDANVRYDGDTLTTFTRVDISMAVAIPGGLITPVIVDAAGKSLSRIAAESKDLAARARDGKLKPEEYTGGTASISNLGMYGIKQFDAVINPPQAMIMAVGAGEKRPYVVGDALAIATVMSATGSFDHRAIDGAVGAQLMAAFKRLVEAPLGMLA